MSTAAVKCSIPEYLNEDLIRNTLIKEFHSDDIVVEEFDVSPATSAGDNYMSDVFRIPVKFRLSPTEKKIEHISFVVKCLPDTGNRGSVIDELNAFHKEAQMFTEVLPKLSKIAGDEFFSAKCFDATAAPNRMLIFHDLKSLGYTMANRQAGLDFDHCAAIMTKIGKLHAASMAFSRENMDLMNKYFNFNMFNPNEDLRTECINVVFEKGLGTLISIIEENWHDFDPVILAKMKELQPVYVKKLEACLTQKFEDGFKVLNHGDLWCNNMLFKYEPKSQKLEDVVFVDYQLSYYSSPGVDINYALSNCPNLETRDRVNDLIDIYYKSLSETLKSINYPWIPTMADVQHEIRRMEFFSLVSVVSILPITMMEKTDTMEVNFENMIDEKQAEQARKIQYNGKQYQAIVKPLLKHFHEKHLLDV
ncbi:AAEL002917-PA [Aedes aegypti]|uniref:AAEL002917-PA n=1 Tax=Aedes aegypti TaxID=7159 RepID=Q17GT1_AEDAE|nr:AAEL002917-PA [Aedes aegypti]